MVVEEVPWVMCRVGMIEVYDCGGYQTDATVVFVALHHCRYMPKWRGSETVCEFHCSVVVSKVCLS